MTASGASSCSTAPNSSRDFSAAGEISCPRIPEMASSVSVRVESSTWPGGRDHIRTLSDMQDERVAVSADDGGQKGFDKGHC